MADDTNLIKLRELSKKLTETESQLSAFFHLCPALLIIGGSDGYFKKVNHAWTRCLGWSEEELCSRPWLDFVHPDDIERTKNAKSVLMTNKELKYFYNRYRHKDGTYRTLRWIISRFVDGQQNYGVCEDVTGTPEEVRS